jgi:type I restriction enzyme S subunit
MIKTTLGDLVKISSGYSPSSYKLGTEGKYPFLKVEDLNNCFKYQTSSREYSNDIKNLIPKGSIIFPKRGAAILTNKVRIAAVPCLIDSNLMALIPNSEKVDVEYLYQKLIKTQLFRIADTSTIPQINNKHILPFEIELPTLEDQIKSSKFMSTVDNKIVFLTNKIDLFSTYKRSFIQEIFSLKIRFTDNGKNFPDWTSVKLSTQLHEHKTLNRNNAHSEVFSVAKHRGVVNQIEHLGRSYAAASISNYKVVLPDDIVYTKSPTSDFPFGIIKQNKTGRTGVVSPLYGVFTPSSKSLGSLLDQYFSTWENTHNYLKPLVRKGAKNTLNISNEEFLDGVGLLLPSSDIESTMIVDALSMLDKKIVNLKNQLTSYIEYKTGIAQKIIC